MNTNSLKTLLLLAATVTISAFADPIVFNREINTRTFLGIKSLEASRSYTSSKKIDLDYTIRHYRNSSLKSELKGSAYGFIAPEVVDQNWLYELLWTKSNFSDIRLLTINDRKRHSSIDSLGEFEPQIKQLLKSKDLYPYSFPANSVGNNGEDLLFAFHSGITKSNRSDFSLRDVNTLSEKKLESGFEEVVLIFISNRTTNKK